MKGLGVYKRVAALLGAPNRALDRVEAHADKYLIVAGEAASRAYTTVCSKFFGRRELTPEQEAARIQELNDKGLGPY